MALDLIFDNERYYILPNYFVLPLRRGEIPNHLTHLHLGYYFNYELKEGDIPHSVTHLIFGLNFNQELKKGDIPNSVTHLTLSKRFNQRLKEGDIPHSVTHLTFGWDFNQKLEEGVIPSSVKRLTFGRGFNQELKKGDIPNSVTHLVFGMEFNRKFKKGVIPDSANIYIYFIYELLIAKMLSYNKINFYNYCHNKKFSLQIPETHIASEPHNEYLPFPATVITVTRKLNIFQEKIKQLKDTYHLDQAVTEFKDKLMISSHYGPIFLDYLGEQQDLVDAIYKQCELTVNIKETINGILVNY